LDGALERVAVGEDLGIRGIELGGADVEQQGVEAVAGVLGAKALLEKAAGGVGGKADRRQA
jgi:hypothetical protein